MKKYPGFLIYIPPTPLKGGVAASSNGLCGTKYTIIFRSIVTLTGSVTSNFQSRITYTLGTTLSLNHSTYQLINS